MTVHQWLAAAHRADAVGDHARRLRDVLRDWGYESDIFALTRDEDLRDEIRPWSDPAAREGDVTILHYAVPSPMNQAPMRLPGVRVLHYHNVTPARFFAPFDAGIAAFAAKGRRELATMPGGVDLALGDSVAAFEGGKRVERVRTKNGRRLECDLVVAGIGIMPNSELLAASGAAVDNGVLVSAALRSRDPDIYAVGDIANAEHPFVGTRIRVEHWANALNQPAVAAGAMLGNDVSYDALPYFYTDQYDLGMEYVGHAPPGSYSQVVVRGDLPAREFVAFWLDAESRVLAGMNVNVWDVTDPIKALIRSRNAMTASILADPTVLLEDLA